MDDKETVRLLRGIPKGDDGESLVLSEPATIDDLIKVCKIIGSIDEKPSLTILDSLTNVKKSL